MSHGTEPFALLINQQQKQCQKRCCFCGRPQGRDEEEIGVKHQAVRGDYKTALNTKLKNDHECVAVAGFAVPDRLPCGQVNQLGVYFEDLNFDFHLKEGVHFQELKTTVGLGRVAKNIW